MFLTDHRILVINGVLEILKNSDLDSSLISK